MPSASATRIRVIGLILFVLGATAFCAGQGEKELRNAQKLIDGKQYNDAIRVLTLLMRDRPEYADRAEELLERIRNERNNIEILYDELRQAVFVRRNADAAREIIRRLEILEHPPSEKTLNEIRQAELELTLLADRNRFDAVMEEAVGREAEGAYWEALGRYVSGFEIGRERFLKSGYDPSVVEQTVSTIDALHEKLAALLDLSGVAASGSDTAARTAAGRTGTAEHAGDAYAASIELLSRIRSVRAETASAARRLESLAGTVARTSGEDFHFSNLLLLLSGRPGAEPAGGIAAACDSLFERETTAVVRTLEDSIEDAFAAGRAAILTGDTATADRAFTEAVRLCGIGLRIVSIGFSAERTADHDSELEPEYPAFPDAATLAAAFMFRSRSAEAYMRYAGRTMPESEFSLVDRASLAAAFEFWNGFRAAWMAGLGELDALPPGPRKAALTAEHAAVVGLLDREIERITERDLSILERALSAELERIASAWSALEDRIDRAAGLIPSLPAGVNAGALEPGLPRNPKGAVAEFARIEAELESLSAGAGAILDAIRNEREHLRNSASVETLDRRTSGIASSLRDAAGRVAGFMRAAEELVLTAGRYRQEGEHRLREATEAVTRAQYENARQHLVRAQDSFLSSLTYQDDPELRSYVDRETVRLSETIVQAENASIVREVRSLITEGKNFYLQGVYDRSEEALLRAQARWGAVNPERNSEIEYWLGFVRSALFVKSSREIDETHPLYAEMTRLLNLALEAFRRGEALFAGGSLEQASRAFNEAEALLLQIKVPFPFNRDANILPFRILNIRDPGTYRTLVAERFAQAKELIPIDPTEAYMSLKDLEEIEPGLRGLDQAIHSAEIALGIRIPPPDPAALAESNRLYEQASRIYAQNNRVQFPIAVEQLARALELNPDNQSAVELKDRIMMVTGGRLSLVLSVADQEEYRRAETKYLEGKYIEALAIVDRLMKKDGNERYQPLVQLKGRIESKI